MAMDECIICPSYSFKEREVKMEFLELFVLGIDIAAIILIGIVVYVFYFM